MIDDEEEIPTYWHEHELPRKRHSNPYADDLLTDEGGEWDDI